MPESGIKCDWGVGCWTGGIVGGAIVLLFIVILQLWLVRMARRAAPGRKVTIWDIIVTGDDNRYSLSRFQVYLWTVIIAVAFGIMSGAGHCFADVPSGLYLLMGINVASAVASTAITMNKQEPAPAAPAAAAAAPATEPDFVTDIFFERGMFGSLDLPRTQMFLWTFITAITYIVVFVKAFPSCDTAPCMPELPSVPTGMVALMGISNGGYLGAKAASS